ncbi:hypothetical protein M513_10537 [Trichuris suis]|uniref:Uncharacterized protein n=1 Tax=Trichuris suis TaxID=68888 RepID=A0A085LUF7_9BILA|nr:hypothetical protein M513_10537 [Trichuris suis]
MVPAGAHLAVVRCPIQPHDLPRSRQRFLTACGWSAEGYLEILKIEPNETYFYFANILRTFQVLDCLESGLCLLCVEKSPRMELFCPSNDTRLLGPLTGNYSIGYVRTYSPFLSSQLLSLVMILKSGFILILGVRYRCGLGSGNNFVIEVTTNAG